MHTSNPPNTPITHTSLTHIPISTPAHSTPHPTPHPPHTHATPQHPDTPPLTYTSITHTHTHAHPLLNPLPNPTHTPHTLLSHTHRTTPHIHTHCTHNPVSSAEQGKDKEKCELALFSFALGALAFFALFSWLYARERENMKKAPTGGSGCASHSMVTDHFFSIPKKADWGVAPCPSWI
jgi:hypothetical protein